jgi:hypothetical protein
MIRKELLMNKAEILAALEESREYFLDAIDGLSDEELQQPGVIDRWSVKDILVHLTHWEAELVKLLWQTRQGKPPSTVHFSKVEVDEMNARWFQESRARSLETALEDFHGVRNQTVRRVEEFSEKDLTDPKRYPWLKGTPLWEWIAGDSFEHEAEHAAQIRAWSLREQT